MLPVDEFLPIMFNQHENSTWKSEFEPRNLIAWSASPLIVFPTHYTGDDGYISDTEDSVLIRSDEGVLYCFILEMQNKKTVLIQLFFTDLSSPRKEKKGNKENYNLESIVTEDDISDDRKIDSELENLFDTNKHSLIIDTDALAESIRLKEPNTEL